MNSMLMRGLMIGLTALSGSLALSAQVVVSSGFNNLTGGRPSALPKGV